jgi:glycosyltransferase involved in cell wall biosynthesis
VGWAPTEWQRALFPTEYRDDIFVLFDGVDARRFRPRDRGGSIEIAGKTLPAGALLVTFAADRPDWVRGVDRFVKVAARLIRSKPQIVCAIVGAGTVDRTLDVRHFGRDFLAECLATATISDDERLWRMGTLDPNTLAQLLAATDLYLDLGRDYSASRIVAEAMASGAPVLATDRPAIRDFIRHGETGCLCYSDPESDQIAEDALRLLEQPDERRALAVSARDDVERRFSHDATLPRLTEKLGGCVERSN